MFAKTYGEQFIIYSNNSDLNLTIKSSVESARAAIDLAIERSNDEKLAAIVVNTRDLEKVYEKCGTSPAELGKLNGKMIMKKYFGIAFSHEFKIELEDQEGEDSPGKKDKKKKKKKERKETEIEMTTEGEIEDEGDTGFADV